MPIPGGWLTPVSTKYPLISLRTPTRNSTQLPAHKVSHTKRRWKRHDEQTAVQPKSRITEKREPDRTANSDFHFMSYSNHFLLSFSTCGGKEHKAIINSETVRQETKTG